MNLKDLWMQLFESLCEAFFLFIWFYSGDFKRDETRADCFHMIAAIRIIIGGKESDKF